MGLRDTAIEIHGQVDGTNAYAGETVFRVQKELDGPLVVSPFNYKYGTVANNWIINPYEEKTNILLAADVTGFLWMCPPGQRWVLDNVTEYHHTGSTSGTLTFTVDAVNGAPGSGTAQLTGTLSLAAATQQVVQQGTLIATPTPLGPGMKLSRVIAGTMTNLANAMFRYRLRRIA